LDAVVDHPIPLNDSTTLLLLLDSVCSLSTGRRPATFTSSSALHLDIWTDGYLDMSNHAPLPMLSAQCLSEPASAQAGPTVDASFQPRPICDPADAQRFGQDCVPACKSLNLQRKS
jgi:hypothetical protein